MSYESSPQPSTDPFDGLKFTDGNIQNKSESERIEQEAWVLLEAGQYDTYDEALQATLEHQQGAITGPNDPYAVQFKAAKQELKS